MTVRSPQQIAEDGYQTRGIAERFEAQMDRDMTEGFLNAGIRTCRVMAIIELKEIINEFGDKIPIDAAKEMHLIKRGDEPVVEIRAFGTRTRIGDLTEVGQPKRDLLIEDAMRLVAQERSIDYDNFSKQDYFNWFIESMAVNVARMHYKSWVHGQLTDHNITLDARIVDLQPVETMDEINKEMAGRPSKKSFDNDVASVEVMLSFFKGMLGLGKEISRPDMAIDDSGSLYVDEDTKEKITRYYRKEEIRLKKHTLNPYDMLTFCSSTVGFFFTGFRSAEQVVGKVSRIYFTLYASHKFSDSVRFQSFRRICFIAKEIGIVPPLLHMSTVTITYSPKQRAEVPRAWKKAAGILRTSAKRNAAEMKKLRREWNKRAHVVFADI